MKSTLLAFLTLGIAQASTLFMGAYPNSILVFDEAQGKVVDRIPLATGLPTSMRLSADKKTIYVTTNDHAGIEVIDVAIEMPADGPSLGTAPAGTWMCRSCFAK